MFSPRDDVRLFLEVAPMMAHNFPILEAVLILPLICKHYYWVVLGCVGVIVLTFALALHGDFTVAVLTSAENIESLSIQVLLAVLASATLFFIKAAVFASLESMNPKPTDQHSSHGEA